MKKLLKVIFVTIMGIFISGIGLFFFLNEDIPEGKTGEQAELLAEKFSEAIRHKQYLKTRYLEWDFIGIHHYKWDRFNHRVNVKWSGNQIVLFPNQLEDSKVIEPKGFSEKENDELIKQALSYFNNDSFWLVAPHKIYDKGVIRSVVKYEGKEALLITYTSGGNTPGDSYLWILDDNNMPVAFKMWVSIIPIGGLKIYWDQWKETESGLCLPSSHSTPFGAIKMGEVKSYN